MSSWLVAIGWIVVALGAYMTWRDGRSLLSRTGPGRNKTGRVRYARRKAWRDLRFSLLWVVMGAGWATSWNKHWLYIWLLAAYIVMLVSWEIGAWLRSRRRKSGGQAATAP
jgi:hypothetical protein